MTKPKHVICCTGGIGVVLGDTQIGLVRMMMQPVENVRRLTHCCRDHSSVEWSVSAGHMRVEDNAGIDAVLCVDSATRSCTAAGAEITGRPRMSRPIIVPDSRHWVFVVRIDDGGTPGDIIVVADVPLRDVDQVVMAQAM